MTMETPMEPSRDDMRRPVDPNVWGVDFPYNSTRATGQIQIGKGYGSKRQRKGGAISFVMFRLLQFTICNVLHYFIFYNTMTVYNC